ncbi:hypothetical protein BGAL_0014g00020 [Botrytis galanthina]|uniref:GST N-terminal domain-containing protein n=1 Tax=Botrytis galanthina TaxID=278940 RepID=A0A4S8RCT3_9HELO|nr:hypothetical protein BGAL_0014g00020 [Botrytis galanthina]
MAPLYTSRVLLPHKLIFVDTAKEEQKNNDFNKLQSFGKVPVLEGGVVHYPSGKKLIQEDDDKAYARFEEACSIEQTHFAEAAEIVGTKLIIKP